LTAVREAACSSTSKQSDQKHKARGVRQRPKPKSRSASIGPDGPKHPGNRQLYDKRGRPDAGAWLLADYPKPKVATFCAALWLTFTLPLTSL